MHLHRSREQHRCHSGQQRKLLVLMLPTAAQQFQLEAVSSQHSPQKYTQHLLSGTPAFHDHAQVGVRSHAGATSNQSPCLCKGMSGVPLTNDITGGPLGVTRTLSPSAGTFTTPMEQSPGACEAGGRIPTNGSSVPQGAVCGNGLCTSYMDRRPNRLGADPDTGEQRLRELLEVAPNQYQ
jgi:hypothetical protein